MSAWQWQQTVGFQLFWFCCVIGGNPWVPLALLLLAAHFIFTPSRQFDIRVALLALIGIAIDTSLSLAKVFVFDAFPIWLGLLWLGFILTVGHSLIWLRRIPLPLQMLIGAIAGGGSYMTAYRFDAVALPLGTWLTAISVGLIWSQLLPLFVMADHKIRGTQ